MVIRAKDVLLRFIAVLDSAGIPYAVGGSLASGVHGQPRTTHDFDLLVELSSDHVKPLVGALVPDFYADESSIREALKRRASFNIIHKASAQKIDVFISSRTGLDREQLKSRIDAQLEPGDPRVHVTSAEVIVLRKLDWYRRGGGASERQLRDVVSVLREQRGRLDEAYLDRMAGELELVELLARVRALAGERDSRG
jgi:hypothetical protein